MSSLKKMMATFGVLLAIVPLYGTSSYAASRLTALEIQQNLENRIGDIVHQFDPNSLVFVQVNHKTKSQSLPGTPFIVKNFSVTDGDGETRVSQIEVTVMTQKGDLPKSIEEIITKLCSPFGPPHVTIKALPSELVPAAAKPTAVDPKKEHLQQQLKNENKPIDYRPEISMLGMISGGLLAAIVLLLLSVTFGWRQIKKSVEQVAAGLDNAAASSKNTSQQADQAQTGNQVVSAEESSESQKVYADLPEAGLVALLADCYWGEFDSYAAFVWKRIPISRRQKILLENEYLAEYADYITGIAELNLGVEQEPYYLNPLPMAKIDNRKLGELLMQFPTLWNQIPSLRRRSVSLRAKDKVELTRSGANINVKRLPDFTETAISKKRLLVKKVRIIPNTIEEEAELLATSNITIDLMESIPSLGWLLHLPETEGREVMRPFSATELASAWIGPEETLKKLVNLVPRKKLELMQSYLTRVPANRNATTFYAIHQSTIQKLREVEKGGKSVKDNKTVKDVSPSKDAKDTKTTATTATKGPNVLKGPTIVTKSKTDKTEPTTPNVLKSKGGQKDAA